MPYKKNFYHAWIASKVPLLPQGFTFSLEENMEYFSNLMEQERSERMLKQSIPWVLWSIWKNRNSILIEGQQRDLSVLMHHASEEAEQWIKQQETLLQCHFP